MIHLPGRKPKTKRIQRMEIELDLLLDIFRGQDGTNLIKTDGIPADAKVVGLTTGEHFNTVTLYVESQEFDEVHEGQSYPYLVPYMTSYCPDIKTPDKLVFTVGQEILQRVMDRWNTEPLARIVP